MSQDNTKENPKGRRKAAHYYGLGWDAAREGYGSGDNPYKRGWQHWSWADGHAEGKQSLRDEHPFY